jgi:hypothetical protein
MLAGVFVRWMVAPRRGGTGVGSPYRYTQSMTDALSSVGRCLGKEIGRCSMPATTQL